jgi:flagellar FliL protein
MKRVFTLMILLFSLHLFAVPIEQNIMVSLDTVTANLQPVNNTQFLTAKIEVEVTNQKAAQELISKKQLLNDAIIRIISSKTSNDISSVEGKTRLKEQIASGLSTYIKSGKIKYVYFSEYTIQ